MQLTYSQDGSLSLKAKQTTVVVDGEFKIGDLKLPGPGEYEAGGVFAEIQPDIAHFHLEEMVIVYLEHSKRSVTEAELEHLENVDVLMVAIDSAAKDELQTVTKLIKEIDPKVVVLVGMTDPTAFAKVDGETPEVVTTLKLMPADLPAEGRTVYLLTV
ncbi:MBL fold metallo-hydrolase [Candidatus Berkelbacteria bacterium]|nr:MBL fold metallo-hydrolase [Candidatus Berkelbacteria bacterium]